MRDREPRVRESLKPETEIRPREDAVIVFIELSSAAYLHRRKRQEKEASRGGFGLGNDTLFCFDHFRPWFAFRKAKGNVLLCS